MKTASARRLRATLCECVSHTRMGCRDFVNLARVVTAKTQYSLKNAKGYFEEHLCVGDYYAEGQRVSGEWFGVGATSLGLSGKIRAEEFLRLCDNQHPSTGEKLTQRLKTSRQDGDGAAAN